MVNRISHNSKTIRHIHLFRPLFLLLICLFTNNSFCKTEKDYSLSINVYLKLAPDSAVLHLAQQFNHALLEQKNVINYQLHPFINDHPLHITLYLTNYHVKHLSTIIKEVKLIASQHKPLTISTNDLQVNTSLYVMLTILKNQALQKLSNETVMALYLLHDQKNKIPAWALGDKKKSQSFAHFGSPNTFNNFSPHFSLLAATSLSTPKAQQLHIDLSHFIRKFKKSHRTNVKANAIGIGIGLADSQGQIVKELASFPLSRN